MVVAKSTRMRRIVFLFSIIPVLIIVFSSCSYTVLNPVSPILSEPIFKTPEIWRNAYPNEITAVGGSSASKQIEFHLAAELPPVPPNMKIYESEIPLVTTDYILEIARRLNLKGKIYARGLAREVLEAHNKMALTPREEWTSLQPEAGTYGRADNLEGGISCIETIGANEEASVQN